MADFNNKLPPYYYEPPQDMNPYHAGYYQPPNQRFVPGNQGFVASPQPTIFIGRSRESDLTAPALFVCFFCCWCTGIPAIIYASKAQNEYDAGNWDKAESNQRTALGWIIGSIVSHICIWILFVILYFTVFAAAASQFNDYN